MSASITQALLADDDSRDLREDAVAVISALAAALRASEAAIQDAYAQADAESHNHMVIAARHDEAIRKFRELRDAALARVSA